MPSVKRNIPENARPLKTKINPGKKPPPSAMAGAIRPVAHEGLP